VSVQIIVADVTEGLGGLASESIQTVVTSPPYWGLRDYGVPGQLGLERTFAEYVEKMVAVFREVGRVLRPDGTLWLNLGDCYNAFNGGAGPGSGAIDGPSERSEQRPALPTGYGLRARGLKPKDMIGIPWRVAFALQDDGWWLRSDIVWSKPNPMPESVRDRPTKAHEYLFLMARSQRYYYDQDAIREPQATDYDGDGRHPIPPIQGAQPQRQSWPDGWARGKEPRTAAEFRATVGRAGISADDYDDRKWADRSDGRSRPPMTMVDREYHPLGRNRRTVWEIATSPFPGAHFATFPVALVEPCIKAGSRVGDLVLDPFCGAGNRGPGRRPAHAQLRGYRVEPRLCRARPAPHRGRCPAADPRRRRRRGRLEADPGGPVRAIRRVVLQWRRAAGVSCADLPVRVTAVAIHAPDWGCRRPDHDHQRLHAVEE
jgi:DNA modification methylase